MKRAQLATPEKPDLIGIDECREILQVSRPTFWKYRKKNNFPSHVSKSPKRWKRADIYNFFNSPKK